MNNRPQFMLGWQSISTITNLMSNSGFMDTLIAYNAYYYFFNDTSLVNSYVLGNFDVNQKSTIYSDTTFGLGSVRTLANWVAAARGSEFMTNRIISYFTDTGMNTTNIQDIIALKSLK